MTKEEIAVERLAPELLLKRGVKVTVPAPLFLKLFRCKEITLTMYHPTARTLLKIAELYMKMKPMQDDIKLEVAVHSYKSDFGKVHRAVTLGFLNSPYRNWLARPLAWWLSGKLSEPTWNYLFSLLMTNGGIEDFFSTIKFIGKTRITKPMNLSPEEKAS